jgi:hypothetical protein
MKQIARSAKLRIIAFLAVSVSFACHDARASGQEVEAKKTNAEQEALQQAIARRARLRRDLSRLIASTRSEETRRGLSPSRMADAAMRIRRLGYSLQEAEAKVSSLELERATAINKVVPNTISREEMCRLRCRDQIEKLLLEKKHLEPSTQCPQTQRRLAEIELSIAEQRLRIAEANVHETHRFPPGWISEQKFRLLLSERESAKMRVDNLRSASKKSNPR